MTKEFRRRALRYHDNKVFARAGRLRRSSGLAAIFACLAVAAMQPAAAGKLSITTGVWVGFGSLYLARDLGIFAEQGLDVELSESGGETESIVAAMASGRVSG